MMMVLERVNGLGRTTLEAASLSWQQPCAVRPLLLCFEESQLFLFLFSERRWRYGRKVVEHSRSEGLA